MADQNNAPELPERIWVWSLNDSLGSSRGWNTSEGDGRLPYIRADRAAPEGQVDREQVVQLCLQIAADRRAQAAGDATVDQKRRWLAGAIQAEIIAEQVKALTTSPAAPTDNTALVEELRAEISDLQSNGLFSEASLLERAVAALASREAPPAAQGPEPVECKHLHTTVSRPGYDPLRASIETCDGCGAVITPPAAQEPVAWRCKDYADDWIIYRNKSDADKYQAVTGCLMQPLYAAPPPACQQRAMPVGCGQPCGYDCNGACFDPPANQQKARMVAEAMQAAITYIDKGRDGMARIILFAALLALKGE